MSVTPAQASQVTRISFIKLTDNNFFREKIAKEINHDEIPRNVVRENIFSLSLFSSPRNRFHVTLFKFTFQHNLKWLLVCKERTTFSMETYLQKNGLYLFIECPFNYSMYSLYTLDFYKIFCVNRFQWKLETLSLEKSLHFTHGNSCWHDTRVMSFSPKKNEGSSSLISRAVAKFTEIEEESAAWHRRRGVNINQHLPMGLT